VVERGWIGGGNTGRNSMARWANAMRMNGTSAELLSRDEVAALAPALDVFPPMRDCRFSGAWCNGAAERIS
jgi:glycine/D-amino acid oxidase-like deaminating enzyme